MRQSTSSSSSETTTLRAWRKNEPRVARTSSRRTFPRLAVLVPSPSELMADKRCPVRRGYGCYAFGSLQKPARRRLIFVTPPKSVDATRSVETTATARVKDAAVRGRRGGPCGGAWVSRGASARLARSAHDISAKTLTPSVAPQRAAPAGVALPGSTPCSAPRARTTRGDIPKLVPNMMSLISGYLTDAEHGTCR